MLSKFGVDSVRMKTDRLAEACIESQKFPLINGCGGYPFQITLLPWWRACIFRSREAP